MTEQLSRLRVTGDFDASGYARGMAEKVAADRAGIAASQALGAALAAQDVAAGKVSRPVEQLSRKYIDGYGNASKFQAELSRLNLQIDKNKDVAARAGLIVEGLQRQYGMTADATQLASRGMVSLAPIVQEVNDRLTAQSAATASLTAANENGSASQAKFARSAGLARHELINFGRQLGDVATMASMDASPMQILASQGAQVADIFMSTEGTIGGFFRQVTTGAARFVTSAAGVTAGMAAIGVAGAYAGHQYAESQREVERALLGTGRAAGLTAGSIERIAEASAAAGRISRSTAREIATGMAATGRIDPSLIGGLTDSSRGYGLLTGKGTAEAGASLAAAFADPTRGAVELDKRLGFLNDSLLQYIRNAEASGDRASAQRALFQAISPALAEAEKSTTRLGRAWNYVWNQISGAAEAVGKFVAGPQNLDERLAAAQATIRTQQDKYAFTRDRSGLAAAQAEEAYVLEEIRRRNTRTSDEARDATSNRLSLEAGDVLRGIFGDDSRLQNLKNQKKLLDETFGDASAMEKLGELAPRVSDGIARLNAGITGFETAAQRSAKDNELQIQQINAYTVQQKIAVEMERARTEAIRSNRSVLEASVEAEQARSRVIAEANRQAMDSLRDARDAASLVGLSPYQRRLRELDNTFRRERDTIGTAGLPGPSARPLDGSRAAGIAASRDMIPGEVGRVLDLIEKYESGGRNVRNYKFGPGFTAQGNFQFTNPTWRDTASAAGVDLKQYPTAMTAPYDVQRRAAYALYQKRGLDPWKTNAPLMNALGRGETADSRTLGDSQSLRRSTALREEYEGWNTPLANANRSLDAQIALQQKSQATFMSSTAEVTRAAEAQRLLNDYASQGIPITADLQKGIDAYAARAGVAAGEAQRFADVQRAISEAEGIPKDALKGLISDFRAGKSEAEAFENVMNRIADKAIDIGVDLLFSKSSSGGGGLLGTIFGALGIGGKGGAPTAINTAGASFLASAMGNAFGPGGVERFALGGAFTNGIVNRPTLFPFANGTGLMGEAGPEAILPLRRNSIGQLGVVAANQNGAGGGVTGNVYQGDTYHIDARGADAAAISRLEAGLRERDRSFDKGVAGSVRTRQVRRTRA